MNKYTYIGKIYKSSIVKNSWLAYINNFILLIQQSIKFIFIKIDGIIIPFFLCYYKQINKNKFLLNFDDSATEENFIGKYIYLNIKKLEINKYNNNKYYYVINYKAIDINLGYIGIINKINDQVPQFLFEIIDANNKIILIPIVNVFIKNINILKKTVLLDIPKELIYIN